jgi:hypothetical protein
MGLIRFVFALVLAFGVQGFAVSANASAQQDEAQTAVDLSTTPLILHGTMWVCSAHNSHGDWQIYWGEPSYDRHQAQHNAVDHCEEHEQHYCVVHDCYQTN